MKEEINYYQVIEGTSYYTEEYVKYLQSQLKAKEEVIKEAREYVKEFKFATVGFYLHAPALDNILSKGENK